MKNKALVIIIALGLLLAGGYGAYTVYKNFNKPSAVEIVNDSENKSGASNLKDLISQGVAQTCTFSDDKSSGSVYVSGGKVRGDFDVSENGQVMKSHMIVMDNTTYIWTDGQKSGFKMAYDPNTVKPTTGSAPAAAGLDLTADNNYKCSTWISDSSKFSLPAGVNFSSFDIPSSAPGSSPAATSKSSQCSYCDALSGSDKAQCLTALKCN